MKNRKVIVTAFLLVAIMILGVGYAAVNNVLDITGTGTVNQSANNYPQRALNNLNGKYADMFISNLNQYGVLD